MRNKTVAIEPCVITLSYQLSSKVHLMMVDLIDTLTEGRILRTYILNTLP